MKTRFLIFAFLYVTLMVSCKGKENTEDNLSQTLINTEMTNQKVIHARIYVKPEHVADFIEAAREIIDSSRTEKGNLSYTLYQDPYNETNFIMVELWKDQNAIDLHFQKSYFKSFGETTGNWLEKDSEVEIFDVTSEN